MKKTATLCILTFLTTLQLSAATLTVKDEPVIKDVTPLGINFTGHNYYAAPKLKISYQENFEGTDYRQCHMGLLEADGLTTEYGKMKNVDRWWPKLGLLDNFYPGAKVTVLSGPAKGQTTTIKELSSQDYDQYGKGAEPFLKFVFETPLDLVSPVEGAGVLIQLNHRDEGCTGQVYGYWMGKGVSLSPDVDPDGFGQSCLLLDGGAGNAFYRTATSYQEFLDNNGTWNIRFKARAASAGAQLTVKADPVGTSEPVDLDDRWKEHEMNMEISGFESSGGDRSSMVTFIFSAPSGQVLLDDIQIRKNESSSNPTVFRDDFVDSLRQLNPGILRRLMMGGAMRDFLEPPLRSFRVSNVITKPVGPVALRKHDDYGFGELLALAEELGAEAWFNIPGTLYPEEMALLMEYLGGPVTTEGGKIRAAQGHPEPWTKTIKKIYLEPGNEAWNTMFNFIAGGYDGPDYWQDLFTRVKESPYYSDNIVCMAAGQNYSSHKSRKILGDTPAADRYAIAPYQVHNIRASELENWPEKADFFRWALAYPFYSMKHSMPRQDAVMKSTGKEFAIYEVSWHPTGGDVRPHGKNHDPKLLEWVNSFVSSVPAALGNFNHHLALLRDYGIRAQCFFNFGQRKYYEINLWGGVLNYKQGEERVRPTGLALSMINQAIFGDMVKVDLAGVPTFTATGMDIAGARKQVGTAENPAITAYAFKEGDRRSLILFNMDLSNAQSATLTLPKGGTAKTQLLAPANYDDNNELENGAPSVVIQDGELVLSEQTEITLPPSSLMTLVW
jgi:hypothetical protein